jgi:hypothetical protein
MLFGQVAVSHAAAKQIATAIEKAAGPGFMRFLCPNSGSPEQN